KPKARHQPPPSSREISHIFQWFVEVKEGFSLTKARVFRPPPGRPQGCRGSGDQRRGRGKRYLFKIGQNVARVPKLGAKRLRFAASAAGGEGKPPLRTRSVRLQQLIPPSRWPSRACRRRRFQGPRRGCRSPQSPAKGTEPCNAARAQHRPGGS